MPTNVAVTMAGQDLKVKGPLGELSITYPKEVLVEKQDSGYLRVRKAVETRRANQMHGLFRYNMCTILISCAKLQNARLIFVP